MTREEREKIENRVATLNQFLNAVDHMNVGGDLAIIMLVEAKQKYRKERDELVRQLKAEKAS